ncbi:MAG: cytochrome c oxidase subunit II [Rhodospirillaceae bacterium]
MLPACAGIATAAAVTLAAASASATEPQPWQMNLIEPATDIMRRNVHFHDLLLVIITAISVFVLALLVYVMMRFRESRNPTPSKTSHNTLIEVLWTVIPVVILVVIAIPSFKLLYYQDVIPQADMTIKVTGKQWYWTYDYPDHGNFTFDSLMVPEADLKPGQPRLLTVDNRIVVPVNATVKVLVTGADVIHSWTVPAFGVKVDANPGRLNERWFKVEREGIYYGQCSELCGVNHAFMPITVEAVSKEKFDAWVAEAKQKFARAEPDGAPRQVAQAPSSNQ